jgi:hypothetical protein
MELNKVSNKISFVFGLLLIFLYVPQLFMIGPQLLSIAGLCLGVYNIFTHGFIRDTSNWKIKPIYFVLASTLIIVIIIFVRIPKPTIQEVNHKHDFEIRLIDQLLNVNQKFPISMGNKDSALSVRAIDDYTLEYRYKMNSNVNGLTDNEIKNFKDETKKILLDKITSQGTSNIENLHKNNINFTHIYLDSNLNEIGTIKIMSADY